MNKPIQSANCGLYCIYVAHVIISSKFPIVFKVNDHDMMRFAEHMMLLLCDTDAFLYDLYFILFFKKSCFMVARTLASDVIAGSKIRFQNLNFFSIINLTNK